MRKRIAAVFVTLMAVIAVVIATASPAMAVDWEEDWAVDVDWYSAARDCTSEYYVYGAGEACIQPNGDDIWVRDNDSDGYRVGVYWEDLDSGRIGRCNDNLGAAKAWTRCNKDWTEGHTIKWAFAWNSASGWQGGYDLFTMYTTV